MVRSLSPFHSLWLPNVCTGYVKVYLYRQFSVPLECTELTLLAISVILRSACWLTYQARYVRVRFTHRSIPLCLDSPCHLLAKHGLLEACFLRTAPFRSMLLTMQSGLHSLAPRAHRIPCISEAVASILTCRLHGAPRGSGRRARHHG